MTEHSDPRPRPQYGEYATPEEQRARIRQPDATWALDNGQDPAAHAAGGIRPPSSVAPAPSSAPAAVGAPVAARRRVDRVVASVLLGYGLVNVVLTILSLSDFSAFADEFFRTAGIDGTFTNLAAGRGWAAAASILLGLGWLAATLLTWRVARRGALVWWIPIVGAVLSWLLFTACIMVPLMSDPAVTAYILRGQ